MDTFVSISLPSTKIYMKKVYQTKENMISNNTMKFDKKILWFHEVTSDFLKNAKFGQNSDSDFVYVLLERVLEYFYFPLCIAVGEHCVQRGPWVKIV